MDFFRFFFPQTYFANKVSDSNEINNKVTTIETSIDQCRSQVDNNSNKLETESNPKVNTNDDTTNNDSSAGNIDKFGVIPTFHNLENVAPTELIPTVTAEASPINVPEDALVINNNDLKGIQIPCEANVSNEETIQNLKDFEEALLITDKTALTTTIETSIDQFRSQVDSNSNKLETESNDKVNTNDTTNDSSVVIIDEFGVIKTFHYLENVAPTELIPTVTAEASPVNVPEDVLVINNNDLKAIQIPCEANVSNDEIIQNLKDFEEALLSIDKTDLTDVELDLINLDDFMEIFDELDPVSEESIAKNDSEISMYGNNENATYSKEIADATNEGHAIINKNVDVISIGSTGDEISQTGQIKDTVSIYAVSDQSDSDDGYNSSDFEFISEAEANMTGFVINYGLDKCQDLSPASSEPLINYCGQYFNSEVEREPSDPGEGPSRQNIQRNEFEDRSYRNNHHIPEGDDYLGLFQGIYNPLLPMSEIYFLENKSVRASAMNSQYDGIGFDRQLALRRHQPDSSENEFEDEAKESAKKILNMYPNENRKRKRRRHF